MFESEKEPFSWGFEAGFLRSPVNPRMLLLNRTPEIDCDSDGNASGNASAWSLVSIANDLLRVDLSSLFKEIGDKSSERANQPFYIDLQNAIRQSPAAPHYAQHTSMDCASEQDHDDRLDPDDPNQELPQEELTEFEIAALLQKQMERDLDFFAPIIDKTITRHARGEISDETRYLLKDVCKHCVIHFTMISDYRYYDSWMNNNAIECDEINRLYRAVITTSDQLTSQEMAALFSSYTELKSGSMSISMEHGSTGLTAPVPYNRGKHGYGFPKVMPRTATAGVCTNIELLRALLIVIYQRCLELIPFLKNNEATELLTQNEEVFPAAIQKSDKSKFRIHTEFLTFDKQLKNVIDFGNRFLDIAKRRLPGNESVQRLEKHLSDIKQINDTEFMRLLRNDYINTIRNDSIFVSKNIDTYAELNNQDELDKLVNRQAVVAKARELYFTEKEWTFASLYARILHELLLCGIMPITCQTCGSLFFPTGPNSKYCDRYNAATKLYCNPRFNAKKHLGRKSPRDVALNIRRKADTAYSKGLTDCAHYFDHLSNFVLDGLGPAYQANDLISDELYRTWLSIVNQPNCRAKIKRPDRLEYPYPVLWYGFVRDGNRYAQVEFPGAEYPTLFECLSQLAESPQSKCTLDYKGPGEHPHSSWHVKLHMLLEIIVQINIADHVASPIPLLGIDGPEFVWTDPTVKDTWSTPDACIYSTGTIDDLSFTVYTKGYDPEKQDRVADAARTNLLVFLTSWQELA